MECKETRELCRLLEARPINAVTYPLVAGTHVPAGWPDRFIAIKRPAFVGHVEMKKGKNKPTVLQVRRIRDLLERGHFACVMWIGDDSTSYAYRIREYLPHDVERDLDIHIYNNSSLVALTYNLSRVYFDYRNQYELGAWD